MKRLLLLLSIFFVLTGCNFNHDELTFSEVTLEKVNGEIEDAVLGINEDGTGNGIYIIDDTERKFYLYLSQEFLDEGKSFGEVEVELEDDSLNIYLNEISSTPKTDSSYKLYEIHRGKKDSEFLRVFKSAKETNIQTYILL